MSPEPVYRRAGSLPHEPTDAPPGSEQKIRIMIERAARREQLFHPLDGPGARGRSHPRPQSSPPPWPPTSAEAFALEPLDFEEDDPDEVGEVLGIGSPEDADLSRLP